MGLDECRGIIVGFQFFTQGDHKHPERGDIIVPAPPPDVLRDIGMRQQLSGVSGKQAEESEFDRGKLQFFIV